MHQHGVFGAQQPKDFCPWQGARQADPLGHAQFSGQRLQASPLRSFPDDPVFCRHAAGRKSLQPQMKSLECQQIANAQKPQRTCRPPGHRSQMLHFIHGEANLTPELNRTHAEPSNPLRRFRSDGQSNTRPPGCQPHQGIPLGQRTKPLPNRFVQQATHSQRAPERPRCRLAPADWSPDQRHAFQKSQRAGRPVFDERHVLHDIKPHLPVQAPQEWNSRELPEIVVKPDSPHPSLPEARPAWQVVIHHM